MVHLLKHPVKNKIMKNLYLIIICLFITNVFSQTYPLNTLFYDMPNGGYSKDLDNVFQPYLGTWIGTLDNIEYKIELVKMEQHMVTFPDGDYFYDDRVVGKYLVTDLSSGTILYTTMSSVNYDDYRLNGLGSPVNGVFDFMYTDPVCLNHQRIQLKMDSNNANHITFIGILGEWNYTDCGYQNQTDIPMPFPNARGIQLFKQ